jgi:hypothetical protein
VAELTYTQSLGDVALRVMPRATIIIKKDDAAELAAFDAWLDRWESSLARKSRNYGCGCCVHMFDVEGSQEAIDAISESIRSESEWVRSGARFGG